MAIEKTKVRTSPRDFFLHLLTIVTLYISAIAFGRALFVYINYYFPDILEGYYFFDVSAQVRWAVASLFVAYPVYILSTRQLEKEYKEEPQKKNLRVRLWLLYFTLFASAVVILTDLITLVYKWLGGEVTIRFALKVLTVFFISAAIFGYYFYTIKKEKQDKNIIMALLAVVTLAVVGAIIGGFIVGGGPAKQRLYQLDQRKVEALNQLQYDVTYFWQRTRRLPVKLDELAMDNYVTLPLQPETGAPYEYRTVNETSFELCAEFNLDRPDQNRNYATPVKVIGESRYQSIYERDYTQGRNCFTVTINPEFYPPIK
jgi:hypothetical protein